MAFQPHLQESQYSEQLQGDCSKLRRTSLVAAEVGVKPPFKTSGWRQFTTLLQRNLTVARRDVTLYWLQLILHSGYGRFRGVAIAPMAPALPAPSSEVGMPRTAPGFLVGAVFWSLDPFVFGDTINDAFNAVRRMASSPS
jgi:hypothetical protein